MIRNWELKDIIYSTWPSHCSPVSLSLLQVDAAMVSRLAPSFPLLDVHILECMWDLWLASNQYNMAKTKGLWQISLRSQMCWFWINQREYYPGWALLNQEHVKTLKRVTGSSLKSEIPSGRDSPMGLMKKGSRHRSSHSQAMWMASRNYRWPLGPPPTGSEKPESAAINSQGNEFCQQLEWSQKQIRKVKNAACKTQSREDPVKLCPNSWARATVR